MRKHQQRQILEILKSVHEAQSAGFYADCQDVAISVGEFIESLEGEGTQTVSLLEEYCELLFKASKGETDEKQLRRHMIKIENSVKTELKPNRIEMAFLSYKASMSDSLETIYLAAKDDPDCDAYWIPIPYYDRNPDGSFGTMHYEGADFYDEKFDITDWREYDIEARHPDVVYTFNPYDAGNYVTSVHQAYYCERLRNMADVLVYVPYFVVAKDIQEHFVLLAGCVFAHMVIVQSESVRDSYIRLFKESYGDRLGKPENKFIALGSPKFDKVINAKRGDSELSDEWKKLIGDKKVIFFNTSVAAILADTEEYLKKLRSVLDTFRNREDIMLWWRPHPLNEATYKSMRPILLNDYEQIISDYRHEGWGIYDYSPNLQRAISWSDAYYGDGSSIAVMFQVTGKPVMYQSVLIRAENKVMNNLAFMDLYDDGESLWVTAFNFNALIKVDKQTLKAEYRGSFPNEVIDGVGLYAQTAEFDGKLYFAPYSANEIAIHDMETGAFIKKEIRVPEIGNAGNDVNAAKFFMAVAYERYIFFVSCFYPAIVRYDSKNDCLDYFSDWVKPLKGIASYSNGCYFFKGIASENKLYLPASCANAVVEFDMATCVSRLYEIGKDRNEYCDICFDGDNYWLLLRNKGAVVKWHPAVNGHKYIEIPERYGNGGYLFCSIVYSNGYVWLIPALTSIALKINVNDETITIADEFKSESGLVDDTASASHYLFSRLVGDRIYSYSGKTSRLVEYNCKTKQLRKDSILFPEELVCKSVEDHLLSQITTGTACSTAYDNTFCESPAFKLKGFLSYVTKGAFDRPNLHDMQDTQRKSKTAAAGGLCGAKIYEYIKSEVRKQ